MAFSYTGGAYNGGSSGTASTGTHGITINSGDLVVLGINYNSSTGTITADQSGWTTALSEVPSGETARHALYWKVAGGSEASAYTFTLSTSSNWQVCLKVFTSATDAEVDSAAVSAVDESSVLAMECTAINGRTVATDGLGIIMGGKDTRGSDTDYTGSNQSYVSPIGQPENQAMAMSHRIGAHSGISQVNMSGPVATPADRTYSIHISFVESSAGGSNIPAIMHHLQNQGIS